MKKAIRILMVLLLVIGILGIIALFSYHRIYEYKLKNPKKDSEVLCVLEDVYNQLKDYSFDAVDFDCDNNVIVLRNHWTNERIEVEYKGDLQSVAQHIVNARSLYDGMLFAVNYTWDGDWYSYYYSDNPNTSALKRLDAVQISENIYYVFLPMGYV